MLFARYWHSYFLNRQDVKKTFWNRKGAEAQRKPF